ncbi:TonB-dependent receptor [Salibacter halophilus]|uniref:TonB-dependent receptor n=1 Tax=Salibacter halophilus TaxID=1803916 RepID=A0A6N6MA74_9FLAO|nr:TonB-dependent receptor [Salibacter halophilus]KAB1065166.1 TonB-dependent receptor [Salibacter halophilus]
MRLFTGKYLIILFLIAVVNEIRSQDSSVYQLNEYQFVDSVTVFDGGYIHNLPQTSLDKEQNGSLSDLLKTSGPAFIKDYGPSGISSLSIRGSSASQTRVYFDDVELNNPSLGQFDLKNIPVWFLDNAMIEQGVASQNSPFGGIGGNIQLNSKSLPSEKFGISIMGNAGSFDRYTGAADVSFRREKYYQSTRYIYREQQNDFEFLNIGQSPTQKRDLYHAAFYQQGFMHESGFMSKNFHGAVKVIHTNTNREIPPIMPSYGSEVKQRQKDDLTIVQMPLAYQLKKWKLELKPAYTQQSIIYQDPLANIDSKAVSKSAQNVARAEGEISKNITLNIQYAQQLNWVENNQLETDKQQRKFSFLHELKYHPKDWNFTLRYKPVVMDDLFDLGVFTGGISRKLNRIKIFGVAARNVRFPTLNDLYWVGAGNPNLQMEEAYNYELGFDWSIIQNKSLSVNIINTVFYNDVDNWIQWIPQENGKWSPENYRNVEQHGLESKLEVKTKLTENLQYSIITDYAYTVAENKRGELSGNQLIYVPKHQFKIVQDLAYKKWQLAAFTQFTGERFTQADNEVYLPSYWLTDIQLSKQFDFDKHAISASFSVNNVFDENYMNVIWRPMPGRWFEFTLRYDFKQK